jgi:hypothetical protein
MQNSSERACQKGRSQIPPTPAGIRSEIEHGSPNTKPKAKVKLQHHQKACQQKVQRVQIAKDCHAPHAKRKRKLTSAGDTARYAKKHGGNQEKPDFYDGAWRVARRVDRPRAAPSESGAAPL